MLGSVSMRFRPSPDEERRQRALALAARLRPPPPPPKSRLIVLGETLTAALERARGDVERLERVCEEAAGLMNGQAPGPAAEMDGGIAALMAQVAAAHGVTLAEIRGRGREVRLMMPRFEIYWTGWYGLGLSTPRIGAACGGRDHSTVLYGRDRLDSILLDTFGLSGKAALVLSDDLRREALKAAFAMVSQRYSQAHTERAVRRDAAETALDADVAARVIALGSMKAAAREMHLGHHLVRRALRRHAQASGLDYAVLLSGLRRRRVRPLPPLETVREAYGRLGSQRATARHLRISDEVVRGLLNGTLTP